MTDKPDISSAGAKPGDEPTVTRQTRDAKAARDTKLAEALRANLHRRKAQVRARDTGDGPGSDEPA